jgi:hypothetical protein
MLKWENKSSKWKIYHCNKLYVIFAHSSPGHWKTYHTFGINSVIPCSQNAECCYIKHWFTALSMLSLFLNLWLPTWCFNVRNRKKKHTWSQHISWHSSLSTLSDYGLDDQEIDSQQEQRIFLLASAFRLALGPNQPHIQLVLTILSLGVKCGWGMTLTTHPHYCSVKKWVGAPPPLSQSASNGM